MRANVVVVVLLAEFAAALWLIACSSNRSIPTDADAGVDARVPNASGESAVDARSGEGETPDQTDAGDAHGGEVDGGIGTADAPDDVPASTDASESGPAGDAASSDAQDAGIQCAGYVCVPPEICCVYGLGASCRTQEECNGLPTF